MCRLMKIKGHKKIVKLFKYFGVCVYGGCVSGILQHSLIIGHDINCSRQFVKQELQRRKTYWSGLYFCLSLQLRAVEKISEKIFHGKIGNAVLYFNYSGSQVISLLTTLPTLQAEGGPQENSKSHAAVPLLLYSSNNTDDNQSVTKIPHGFKKMTIFRWGMQVLPRICASTV